MMLIGLGGTWLADQLDRMFPGFIARCQKFDWCPRSNSGVRKRKKRVPSHSIGCLHQSVAGRQRCTLAL
jgi:hypothetical protein